MHSLMDQCNVFGLICYDYITCMCVSIITFKDKRSFFLPNQDYAMCTSPRGCNQIVLYLTLD